MDSMPGKSRSLVFSLSIWLVAIVSTIAIWRIGRFPFLDEAVFKAGGMHWAISGDFVCPELSGFIDLTPPADQVVLLHVPVYPFLFGLLVKLLGFGWSQTVLFDALVHGALIVTTYYLARQFARFTERELNVPLPASLDLLAPIAIAPLAQAGRPDELAMCFGFAGLFVLMGEKRTMLLTAVSGALFGLCAGTSLGAAVVLGFFAFFLIFTERRAFLHRFLHGTVWQLMALLALSLSVLPILLKYPQALNQFFDHAKLVTHGKTFMEFTVSGWVHARHRILPVFGFLSLALLALPLLRHPRWYLSTWLGLVLGAAFIFFFLPGEFLYFWFFTPWLFAASAVTIVALAKLQGPRLAWAASGLLALFAFPVFVWGALQWLCILTLPDNQRADYNAKLITSMIPEGSTVLTDYYWCFLPGNYRVYSPTFSGIKNLDDIDYVILSPIGGGGPGRYQWMRTSYEKLVAEKFHPSFNNLPTEPLTVAGIKLTKTTWGFGFILFSRTKEPTPAPDSIRGSR